MSRKVGTPWGRSTVVEELALAQRAGNKRFASVIELLEGASGEVLIRFAYSTGGAIRRGPVTLRSRDLERLSSALDQHPELARTIRLAVGSRD